MILTPIRIRAIMTETTLARLNRAMDLQINGQLDEAEAIYRDILITEPDNPDAIHLLGLVLGERDDNEGAVALIEKAIQLRPGAAPFHHNIAGIYRRIGRLDDAEQGFRTAISLKADYGEAYQGLAEMVTFDEGDPFIRAVAQQLNSGALSDPMRSYFHFAAGKYFDDVGDYANAFEHYRLGNLAANKPFDSAEFRQQVKDTIYVFSRTFIESHSGGGNDSHRPIFIVGMPRSGTSLVEQILASHSGVFGAGELNDMKFVARLASQLSRLRLPYPNSVPGLGRSQMTRLAEDYLARIAALSSPEAARVIDKHPLNFQFVGLILLMFPNAKIIHTVRHPLDTCLSCFFQNFTKGQHYSFDMVKLGHFYNDYRRLMEHWDLVFPGRILQVEYESVTDDQEPQTRRILDYCDLEFEPQCLEFHKTQRVVKTASFLQVRKPLYQTSRGRWRNYVTQLQELAGILGMEVTPPVTITMSGPSLSGR